jgi:HK97 family phage major capsid protein
MMSDNSELRKLFEAKHKIYEEMKGLAERSGSDEMSAEDKSKWDGLNTRYNELNASYNTLTSIAKAEVEGRSELDALTEKREAVAETEKRSEKNDDAVALRKFALGKGGKSFVVNRPDGFDMRQLVKGTPAAGGYTVPISFYGRLVEHLIENAAILRTGATILNSDSGEALQIPKTTQHQSASIVAEAATIPVSDPVFGQVTLGAYKYGYLFQVSYELLADTGVDLEGYFARQAGVALGNAFGAHAINGTGTGQPRGVLLDATAGVTGPAGAGGGFGSQNTAGEGADLLIDLYHSVIEPYRRRSSTAWMMNDQTAAEVRKLKTADGVYVWQPSIQVGDPDMILGKPVIIDPNMPDIGVGAESILFGDFSAYFARLVGGVRFERSEHFAFDEDMTTFRALWRADGATVDTTGALKTFTGGAA